MSALILALTLTATSALHALPAEDPRLPDSSTKAVYWVRDRNYRYEVFGIKAGTMIRFDPHDAFNAQPLDWAHPIPAPQTPWAARGANQGVDLGKTRGRGYEAPSGAGKAYIEGIKRAQLRGADPAKLRLTIYGGTEEDRGRVLADLKSHPALAPHRDTLEVQSYPAGHWAVDPQLGYQPGTPAISLQLADGRELWRAADYAVGPEGLARAIEGGRRVADPSYRPEATPGPGRSPALGPGVCPLGFSRGHLPALAGTALLCLWLMRSLR